MRAEECANSKGMLRTATVLVDSRVPLFKSLLATSTATFRPRALASRSATRPDRYLLAPRAASKPMPMAAPRTIHVLFGLRALMLGTFMSYGFLFAGVAS